ncbi:MAG: tail fiber domain-containing protein [Methylobacter sp.]|jgi:hypothetical protein|uniref:tail fiber domain-containing protein n=1 Tax=Methylobacter sp. TaxID=2051955 RepID=UPI0025DC8C93|nr:tail fiber domain-containing protein [Methylobacter sp.]MCK9621367.1 tail fiber domain-containing protein [Methylobacter sp.]
MSSSQNQRPRFFQGQYLGAEDLSAAVDYSRIQMARHTLGAHSWGIATGLQIKEKKLAGDQIEIYVMPGYAWDGFGRPITLLAPYKIPTELFKSYVFDAATDNGTPEGRLIKVWLRYDESLTQNARPGFEVCDIEGQNSRVQEAFRVEVGERSNHIDQHDHIMVAGNSIDAQEVIQKFDSPGLAPPVSLFDESVPYQDLPESDAKVRWLIPLGCVRWKPNPNLNQSGNFVKRSDDDLKASRKIRRYIGVVAESIQAADGILRMRDRTKDYSDVQSDDLVWVEGKLRVDGDARLFGSKLDFLHKDGQDFNVPLRVQRAGDPGLGNRALQVIIGPDTQTNNRFAVGPLKAGDGTVDEKFVVLSGGNVGIGTTVPRSRLQIKNLTTIDEGKTAQGAWANFGSNAYYDSAWKRIDSTKAGVNLHMNADDGAGQEFRFLRVETTGSQRNIAVVGTNLSYFESKVGIGTAAPAAKLEVAGDVALEKIAVGAARALPQGATLLWNDGTWLRLNQNLDFSKPILGVHTPGLFASGSLNVGGAGNWGDPGAGNVWITGNVGIGTTVPATKLHILGNRIRLENSNKHVDIRADGSSVDLHSETNHLYVRSSGPGGNNNVIINPFATDGNVGIGTEAPTEKLHLIGNLLISEKAYMPGGGTWTAPSDERLKKNIEPLANALNKLLQLRGVRFEWQEPEKMGNLVGPQLGLIAQEVEKVFPEWISTGPEGYKELTIRGFEALTIEALRELKKDIENLRQKREK